MISNKQTRDLIHVVLKMLFLERRRCCHQTSGDAAPLQKFSNLLLSIQDKSAHVPYHSTLQSDILERKPIFPAESKERIIDPKNRIKQPIPDQILTCAGVYLRGRSKQIHLWSCSNRFYALFSASLWFRLISLKKIFFPFVLKQSKLLNWGEGSKDWWICFASLNVCPPGADCHRPHCALLHHRFATHSAGGFITADHHFVKPASARRK